MSGTITLTAAMRANLLSLQNTANSLSTTQLALSTGNKVNSALDNPVNYFASQALSTRASSLSALLDGMGQAIQTLQATNQGITSITSLVHQLTSIANTAKTDLNNTTTVNTFETGGASGMASTIVAGLTSGGTMTAGDTFTLTDGTNPAASFSITTNETLADLVGQINQVTGLNANVVYGDGVTKAADGVVMASGKAYLSIVSTDGQAISAADVSGTSLAGLGLDKATGSVAVTTGGDATDIQSYADVIAQINQTVTDSNYQGNNLIDGISSDLTVQVNEKSAGAIVVSNVDLRATTGLGLTATASTWTGGSTSANLAAIDASITKINTALSTLQTKATSFANDLSLIQNRQDFTTNLINTLQNGSSQLVIADKNEEGANLLALQTQQQLGIEALSLSSQANQSVLRLFG